MEKNREKSSNLHFKVMMLMHIKKISQKSAAEKSGITYASLNRYINGHSDLSGENLIALLSVVGIDVVKQVDQKYRRFFEE